MEVEQPTKCTLSWNTERGERSGWLTNLCSVHVYKKEEKDPAVAWVHCEVLWIVLMMNLTCEAWKPPIERDDVRKLLEGHLELRTPAVPRTL